jgi:hypothetical protein
MSLTQRRKGAKNSIEFNSILCAFAPLRENFHSSSTQKNLAKKTRFRRDFVAQASSL